MVLYPAAMRNRDPLPAEPAPAKRRRFAATPRKPLGDNARPLPPVATAAATHYNTSVVSCPAHPDAPMVHAHTGDTVCTRCARCIPNNVADAAHLLVKLTSDGGGGTRSVGHWGAGDAPMQTKKGRHRAAAGAAPREDAVDADEPAPAYAPAAAKTAPDDVGYGSDDGADATPAAEPEAVKTRKQLDAHNKKEDARRAAILQERIRRGAPLPEYDDKGKWLRPTAERDAMAASRRREDAREAAAAAKHRAPDNAGYPTATPPALAFLVDKGRKPGAKAVPGAPGFTLGRARPKAEAEAPADAPAAAIKDLALHDATLQFARETCREALAGAAATAAATDAIMPIVNQEVAPGVVSAFFTSRCPNVLQFSRHKKRAYVVAITAAAVITGTDFRNSNRFNLTAARLLAAAAAAHEAARATVPPASWADAVEAPPV